MRDWLITKSGQALFERHMLATDRTIAERAIAAAAAAHQVSAECIKSRCRRRKFVRARWYAMRLMRDAGLSLPKIGHALNMDHTSVMHGLRNGKKNDVIHLIAEAGVVGASRDVTMNGGPQ